MNSVLWQAWQAVKAPPRFTHPLYQRGTNSAIRINNALSCALIFGAFLFIVPLLLFVSTVIGAVAAAASSAAVSREREANRFNLLATTPEGVFGASWLLALGAVHRRDAYQRLQSWRTWAVRGAFVFILYVALESAMMVNSPFTPWQLTAILLGMALVMVGFYVDHIHALTLGVLVGLALPTYARDRIGAETGAVMVYLAVRVFTLLVAFLVMFGVLAPLFDLLPPGSLTLALLRLAQFAVFVLLNEAVTRIAWHIVRTRLDADPSTLRLWGLPT